MATVNHKALLCPVLIIIGGLQVVLPATAQPASCTLSPSSGGLSFDDRSATFQSTIAVIDIISTGMPAQLKISRSTNFMVFPADYLNDADISYQFQLIGANNAESQASLTSDVTIALSNSGSSQLRLQVMGKNRNSRGFVAGDYRLQFRVSCSPL
ncbi:hypothetical protein [Synechococcus elongatus]|nr:hypothetical protein [Synechococcus elongatus]AJD58911.1 hypothetical protein M744_12205 [Synechococcus elongatus UTEX 2973]MBD2587339.1 hypothetical protein [Synechococcus elongatus FACHB-242]MBD2688881.1 hypothetical protein [Synechococcus elongatus FACHB-1061]MBD2707953.1 hypothetical protein [Synechococcus elongatus PCC 7942 = FACHB-805]UOW70709.1 hypothetical protein PCC7943_0949 [Synechococcus elongatus PCC 7943]